MAEDVRDDWDEHMIWVIALLAATHHPYLAAAVLAVYLGWTSLWS